MAVAAPREVEAVLHGTGASPQPLPEPWAVCAHGDRLHVLRTGVGKPNAAGAVAAALTRTDYALVLSLGIAGSLPNPDPLEIGQTLLADACVLADDGLRTPQGFLSQHNLGFPAHESQNERLACDATIRDALAGLADHVVGSCATVSTCSGTDDRAAEIASRTNALAEDMESAAVALVAARLGVPFGCLRVISNRTGDREQQGWDLDRAFSVLQAIASAL